MAQQQKRQPHHSIGWTVAQKRQNLWAINLTARFHARVYVPSFAELPLVGYLTPEEFRPASAAAILNPLEFSDVNLDPALATWAAANEGTCPAIRFKVNGIVREGRYVSTKPPEFTFGLLNIEPALGWECIPNIRQLWLQPVWALTGCQPTEWLPHVYEGLVGRTLEPEFTPLKDLTRVLASHQKIFLAITFLHPFWRSKNYLATGAGHLKQARVVSQLEKNNFSNYLGEAGARPMSDSQLTRHWAKLINASAKLEKFRRDLKARRNRAIHQFVKANARNPTVFEVLDMLDS